MTKNATKRALLSSALALVVCISMLIGTTYAWFTDSVTSANNIITSGNLDVELEYATVVDGQITAWTTVQGADKIFNPEALWEPGRVEVVYLKVSNLGSLALKYQLGVNVVSEIEGVNAKGDTFKLSDYLVFKVINVETSNDTFTTYTDREAVQLAAGTEMGLKDYNGNTTALKKGEKDYVALIVYMPETVDNVANHNGEDVPVINLGINLFATQQMAEEDSFGNDYDEDAWDKALKVHNASELYTAINDVEDGGLIVLADNVTFDENTRYNSSGTWYEGLYYEGDKSFTIDLNGKTVTNDSSINDYLMLFKNNGSKANTITFKNGTLEASSSAYCAICTSTTSTQKITINLENVKVIGNNSNGAVLKIRGGAELNTKAGTIITGTNSYVGIEVTGNNTVANINNGTEIYQNGTSSYVGSLLGVSNNATANVYGGYGKSAQGAFIAMTSGGTINVYGGNWIANTDGTYANSNKSALIAQSSNGASSVINVYGGNILGGYNCYGNAVGDAQIRISGGIFNADPSAYVADDFKAINNNGKFYVVSKTINTVVSTPAEIEEALSNAADAGSGDSTVYLAGDIDMTGAVWTPINVDGYNGAGVITIEGNGATIKGLTAPLFKGGFAGKSGIVIKNLTIADSNIVSTSGLGGGAFIDTADSMHVITLENCHLINSKVTGERTGGLIGWCSGYAKLNDGPVKANVTISNCSVIDSEIVGAGSAGAIAGHPGASDYTYTTIEDCVVNNVKVTSNDTDSWRTGAIVGTANNGHIIINNVSVENVTLTQNGVTSASPVLFGRFVPAGTGTLVIDGANVVDSAAALATALTANEKVISVMLAKDIDLPISTLGTITGGSGEYKLGGESTEKINIDLNGKKLNITTTYWSVLGAKNANATFTIKNGTMTSSQATGTWNSYDLEFANCNYVIENVNFEKAIAFTNANKTVNIKNVTIKETHDYYAMWISAKGQTVEIDNLTVISNGRGIKIDEQYVDAPAKVTLNIKNSKFTTAKKAAILVKSVAGAAITVENFDISNVNADSVNAVWVDSDAAASANKVTVNGNAAVVEQ